MPSLSHFAKVVLLVAVSLLSACASTGVSEADLYKPNHGLQVFPHFDAGVNPDPLAVANGLYSQRPLRYSQSQSSWVP